MLPPRLEDGATLAVGGVLLIAAKTDEAIRLQRDAEVLPDAGPALQLRKEARHRLCVVPDVSARALAGYDALPRPESPVLPPLSGTGGEIRRRVVDPIEQPKWQCTVVVGVAPFSRVGDESLSI